MLAILDVDHYLLSLRFEDDALVEFDTNGPYFQLTSPQYSFPYNAMMGLILDFKSAPRQSMLDGNWAGGNPRR